MNGVQLTKRGFLVTMILQYTFITWYYIFLLSVLRHVFSTSAEIYLMAYASFNFIIVITLFFNRFFLDKINKLHIIYESSIALSITTILLSLISNTVLKLIIIFASGVFFSMGQLVSYTYFWSLTVPEERGRVVGLAGFFFLPLFHFITLMAQTSDFQMTMMLIVILSLVPLTIKLLRPEKKTLLTRKKDEKGYRPEKRTVFLYSVPWIIFYLVNITLARNTSLYVSQHVSSSVYMILLVLQVIAANFGALGGGILADLFGRRLSLCLGLTLYGISSALGGFVENSTVLYFTYIINGLTWGTLWVMYSSVVWGDLADKESYTNSYSIGLIIFYSAMGVGFFLNYPISQIPLAISSLLSCALIFFANVPLILAPELLSLDFREKIRLKLFMNVIRKIKKQSNA